jgi:hypothetical protein
VIINLTTEFKKINAVKEMSQMFETSASLLVPNPDMFVYRLITMFSVSFISTFMSLYCRWDSRAKRMEIFLKINKIYKDVQLI